MIMASGSARRLSSDPEYLLSLMSQLDDESDREEEFDGWLGEDDGPQVVRFPREQPHPSSKSFSV